MFCEDTLLNSVSGAPNYPSGNCHLTIHLAPVILDSENRGIKTNTLVLNLLQCLAGLFSPTCKMDEIPAMVAAGDFGRLCCFGGGGDTSGADVDDAPAFVLSLVVTVAPT